MKFYKIEANGDYNQEDYIFSSYSYAKEWFWKQVVDIGDDAFFPGGIDYMMDEGIVWIREFTLVS